MNLLMPPRWRRTMLAIHVGTSVGWMGSVAVFIAIAVLGLTLPPDGSGVAGVYASLNVTLALIITPLALLSLLTGVIQSLGTTWGLLRHWWVVVKLLLTLGATAVLLLHSTVAEHAAVLAESGSTHLAPLQMQLLVDSVAGFAVLTLIAVLGWVKPKGRLALTAPGTAPPPPP